MGRSSHRSAVPGLPRFLRWPCNPGEEQDPRGRGPILPPLSPGQEGDHASASTLPHVLGISMSLWSLGTLSPAWRLGLKCALVLPAQSPESLPGLRLLSYCPAGWASCQGIELLWPPIWAHPQGPLCSVPGWPSPVAEMGWEGGRAARQKPHGPALAEETLPFQPLAAQPVCQASW